MLCCRVENVLDIRNARKGEFKGIEVSQERGKEKERGRRRTSLGVYLLGEHRRSPVQHLAN